MTRLAFLTAASLCLGATTALALPDVEVGFDPTQASPGDQVHFFFTLDNVGTEARLITVRTTVQFGDHTVGPFTRRIFLGAGQGHVIEFDFTIPQQAPAGTLTVTTTATDDDGSDTDVATLEIVAPVAPKARSGDDLAQRFGKELVKNGLDDHEVK